MKSGLLAAVPAHNLIYNIVCDMKAINLNLETIQKYTQHYINKRSIIMKQQLRVFLTLLLCAVASVGWGQTSVTIWDEDWSTGKKNDLIICEFRFFCPLLKKVAKIGAKRHNVTCHNVTNA